jgi:hypothetical protein
MIDLRQGQRQQMADEWQKSDRAIAALAEMLEDAAERLPKLRAALEEDNDE